MGSLPIAIERRVIVGGPDSDLRRTVGAAMRADGYEVIEVGDGVLLLGQVEFAEAALGLRPGLVAVVMTDMGITGLEVLGILRRIYRKVPVMFVTGSGSGRMAAEARRLGASGVFTTPVDVDVLKGAVRNAMA